MRRTIRSQPRVIIEITSESGTKAITLYPDEGETCIGISEQIKEIVLGMNKESKVKVSARTEVHDGSQMVREHLWAKTVTVDSKEVFNTINSLPDGV